MSCIQANKKGYDSIYAPLSSNLTGKDNELLDSLVIETPALDLFALALKEEAERPASKVQQGKVQTRNAFSQPYLRDNVVPVPFRVSFCLSVAAQMMKAQGVDFVPLAVVLAVAKEFNYDLSMQGRKPASQVKAQVKAMKLGSFADVTIKQGTKQATLTALTIPADLRDKVDSCRYSLLASVSA